jgi:hypothetical protein
LGQLALLESEEIEVVRGQIGEVIRTIGEAALPPSSEGLRDLAETLRAAGEAVDLTSVGAAATDLRSKRLLEWEARANDALVCLGELADDVEELGDLTEEFEPSDDPDYDPEDHAQQIKEDLVPNAERALEAMRAQRAMSDRELASPNATNPR